MTLTRQERIALFMAMRDEFEAQAVKMSERASALDDEANFVGLIEEKIQSGDVNENYAFHEIMLELDGFIESLAVVCDLFLNE